jgi:hypothetical protein
MGFMKYAVEMGSGARILIPNFINISSDIQKLIHRQHGDIISLLLFYQNKEGRLKIVTFGDCSISIFK